MKNIFVGMAIVASVVAVAPMVSAQGSFAMVQMKKKAPVVPKKKLRPTAECEDGTSIYTIQHKGACALHGGVMQWFIK